MEVGRRKCKMLRRLKIFIMILFLDYISLLSIDFSSEFISISVSVKSIKEVSQMVRHKNLMLKIVSYTEYTNQTQFKFKNNLKSVANFI